MTARKQFLDQYPDFAAKFQADQEAKYGKKATTPAPTTKPIVNTTSTKKPTTSYVPSKGYAPTKAPAKVTPKISPNKIAATDNIYNRLGLNFTTPTKQALPKGYTPKPMSLPKPVKQPTPYQTKPFIPKLPTTQPRTTISKAEIVKQVESVLDRLRVSANRNKSRFNVKKQGY